MPSCSEGSGLPTPQAGSKSPSRLAPCRSSPDAERASIRVNERRAFERVPFFASIDIRRGTGATSKGSVINISAGGLSFYSEASLRPHEVVTVWFALGDPEGQVALALEVLESDDTDLGARIRGRFVRPDESEVQRIEQWIERSRPPSTDAPDIAATQ